MDYKNELGNWEEIILEPSGDTLPIGAITQFSGDTAPTNWLFCNGQAISRTEYSELFATIGTTYGEGDGSTTFNLPDFIGRVPVGLDVEDSDFDALGDFGGEKTHTLTIDEMPSHAHEQLAVSNPNSGGSGIRGTYNGQEGTGMSRYSTNAQTGTRGGDQPHNIMQPYLVTNFIIKVKQSVGIVGTVTNDIDDPNVNAVPNASTVKNYVDEKSLDIFSTEERVIGKWVDDKPIYRKVINFGSLPNATTKNVPHNISNLESCIHIYGVAKSIVSGTFTPLPFQFEGGDNTAYNTRLTVDSTNVTMINVTDRSRYNAYVIIEYTKTTD